MAINYRQLRYIYRQKNGEWRIHGFGFLEGFFQGLLLVLGGGLLGALLFSGCRPCFGQESGIGHPSVNMAIIAQIESSNNPSAYNKRSGAIGLCQITPIVLKEWNNRGGVNVLAEELFIASINMTIADWYMNERIPQMLKHYGIEDTINNRLWAYNAGVGMVKRGIMPKETKDYIAKYERMASL